MMENEKRRKAKVKKNLKNDSIKRTWEKIFFNSFFILKKRGIFSEKEGLIFLHIFQMIENYIQGKFNDIPGHISK